MSWKLRSGDILHFADEDGDEGEDEQPAGGGPDDTDESDVDKVRSTYDKQIAALRKELTELQRKQEEGKETSVASQAYTAALAEVNAVIQKLTGEKDTAKLHQIIQDELKRFGHAYGLARSASVQFEGKYKSALAESLAASIQFEAGGDVNTYKAQLAKAKTEDEMRLMATNLRLEVGKKPRKKASESSPRIDRGSGGAARTNVLQEMLDIDISTPEGQKQWQEKERALKSKIDATLPSATR